MRNNKDSKEGAGQRKPLHTVMDLVQRKLCDNATK